jgi:catechol 2,3-dioxygenase-like lactoylglutathione lyase family enzyme
MTENGRLPRAVGVNHVALEVEDVEAAVAFYSRLFALRGISRAFGGAFLDLGDQFIALFPPGCWPASASRGSGRPSRRWRSSAPTASQPRERELAAAH